LSNPRSIVSTMEVRYRCTEYSSLSAMASWYGTARRNSLCFD
jgi:hypothetical protein